MKQLVLTLTPTGEAARAHPHSYWWLKADGCDINAGLMESTTLQWNGDVDLINANCLEQGSIDKPLTFDVGLIQLSFIPVCSLNTCNISVKLCRGFALQCFSLLYGI